MKDSPQNDSAPLHGYATSEHVPVGLSSCRTIFRLFVVALCLAPQMVWSGEPVKSLLETRHEHVTLQEWDLSCGAAAVTTLLRYQHGDPVTEKEVAEGLISRAEYIENPELVKIREGFSLLDLKRYVDSRGYQGNGYGKMDLDDLVARAPILVPINALGYNHFVVFRGRVGNRVLLADPAWGNRTMTVERFKRLWINYPQIGHVGFTVADRDKSGWHSDLLAPHLDEFVTFD